MPTARDLLSQGRRDEVWTKYCGFLDFTMQEFQEVQERLLMEQLSLIKDSQIGKKFLGDKPITSVEEFRNRVPVRSYEDYEIYFEQQREDVLPQMPFLWARTSGRSGRMKWIPYTKQAYRRHGERVLAGVILGAARKRGDVRIESGDTLVYNTPPRPYISGVSLMALSEHFDFRFVPSLDMTEEMGFQERIEKSFTEALTTGIDVLGSMSVVLVKMGERFAEGARTTKISPQMLHPRVIWRFLRGYLRSRLEGRSLLPKDLWKVKSLPTGGMDTSIYKDKIAHYWGAVPYESYGSTEAGVKACQAWNLKGMTFFPDAAFFEFIPEEEWARGRRDPSYSPSTVLMHEVETKKRYEVVITNFYGMPLLRYRMHDMIQFLSLTDEETGVKLPQMEFVGRTGDFIDLAGFSGLIDEKMVWKAIVNSGVPYEEWAMTKEVIDGEPTLHLYIEPSDSTSRLTIQKEVHKSLKDLNSDYANYETMIGKPSLVVTVLPKGTFQGYMMAMQASGADLAHLKPPHMNPSRETVDLLLQLSKRAS